LQTWGRLKRLAIYTEGSHFGAALQSKNLYLNEAIVVAHDRPLWRLMSTFGTTHS